MSDGRDAVERTARDAYGRLLASLVVRTRDAAAAEDALADAFARALARWPTDGVPAQPEAWLRVVALNRLRDRARRAQHAAAGEETLMHILTAAEPRHEDERLRLLFACGHPAIDEGVRTPLMLQLVLGLDAETIAQAFLHSPAAMAKRLVRAKHKIRRAGVPFELPGPDEWPARLGAVIDAIYAAYGRAADGVGPEGLRGESLHLADVLLASLPDEPEVLGLAALLGFIEARARGCWRAVYRPLSEQDPDDWDGVLERRAEALLRRAGPSAGRYGLEAAIQACHHARIRGLGAGWPDVLRLYRGLLHVAPSVGAYLGACAAAAEVHGDAAALEALDALDPGAVADHQPYWALRAELATRLGEDGGPAYDRAIALAADPAVKAWLLARSARRRPGRGSAG